MIRLTSIILTFLGGLYFFLEFLLPEEIPHSGGVFKFGLYLQEISLGVNLISGMALGLGVINILIVHGRIILSWRKGAFSSLSLLLFFCITLVVQLRVWVNAEQQSLSWRSYDAVMYYVRSIKTDPTPKEVDKIRNNLNLLTENPKFLPAEVNQVDLLSRVDSFKGRDLDKESIGKLIFEMSAFKVLMLKKSEEILANNLSSKMERLIMKSFFSPLGMSMFSLLAFYIGYAAYRTFRVQSKEALAMMIVALFMILGQIPQGVNYISADLPELRFWLLENLSNPAFRAIYFSSAIAGLGLAVRMWFSMEKSPF
jgi:hypothetical protein